MGRCKSSKRITTHRKSKNSIQGIEKSNKTSNTNDKDVKGVSDIIDHNLDVIFVGVVPSCKNAARKEHYYCSSSNQFYKLLHESGFTERKLKPEEDGSLLNYKIGLMNIRTKFTQKNLIDPKEEIREEIETFIEKIRKYKPKFICFNGKDGFATFMSIKNDVAINKKYEFGFKNDDKIDWIDENGFTKIYLLPSTGGLNSSFRYDEKKEFAKELKSLIKSDNDDVDDADDVKIIDNDE
ncbi:DNA glycosylase [Rhizophagus irregularis]|uniref:Uracil-DNA glycosylase-like protein n=3 Tax=Rhizophagus irregularis TaxID=588596 RepID=U9TBN1_RHIID|nr:uracil-DNA glycosylase-like protein [Rhizophagus irregularis DAOM 181602=DAOM 197198]EXX59739.1 hypothetical protein RirG_186210 [Rhizophagus irregularis DAOM 197198w]PKC17452.1 DNA glycosylase [Rhizophagus irregularis]PKC75846.1 DNA glycosylase [Rhizophagus irregularis]PKY12511.1 DNA glycosylase [Rhizophagus irregularis]PKY39785.1 DNA glycosylase [Rhizophagus irregularis]|eukprot:XP_025177008.1 uracil-DNA glycosylase-like protein [Rhizophagus irregularis DAOM 181602=DAOM 197198]